MVQMMLNTQKTKKIAKIQDGEYSEYAYYHAILRFLTIRLLDPLKLFNLI